MLAATSRRTLVNIKVTGSGNDKTITGNEGDTLLEIFRNNGIQIGHACGGHGACGTCHVQINKGMNLVGEASDTELDTLDSVREVKENSRLACLCSLTESDGDIDAFIPPSK